ncbi:MAG: hypothetical protein BWK79_17780 [Beggiatoa sp. IS2]|nr:MAG: hypothetical protein BWK79_17780 [Beggiatoa sp. IS2]
MKSIPIWDVPVRLFHWTIVGLVLALWITAEQDWMEVHVYCGIAVLILLLFRVLWGVFGNTYARFSQFVCGIPTVVNYVANLFKHQPTTYLGHNPLGGWSVILLLTMLFVQATTGLFAYDDVATEGPLYHLITEDAGKWLSEIHEINFNILLVLIVLHVSALFFYRIFKHENLVLPMLTGCKRVTIDTSVSAARFVSSWLALLLLGLVAAVVYVLLFVVAVNI